MQLQFRGLLFLLLAPLAPLAAERSSDVQALTLDAAVEQALLKAPQLAAQVASHDAAQALTVSAGRLPDPQLVLGLDNLPVTGADAYSTTRDFMTMRRIGVMQEFPATQKRRLRRDRAEAQSSLAGAELTQVRLAIAREVADAWIRRRTAATTVTTLQALEPDLELQASAAEAAIIAGRGSTAEALAAQTAVVQLANRVIRLQSEERRAVLELERWVGQDALRPLGPMPAFDQLPVPAAALLASVHEHGALLPFDARAAVAQLDIELAKADRRPDWSAELAYSERGPDFSDMVSFEVRIGLPLFAGHRQNPVVAAKGAELRRIEAERESEVRMHTAELRQVLTEWELLGQQIEQYERQLLPLTRARSRAALAAYRAGQADLRLALDAFQQEVESLIEHASLTNERGRVWAYLRYLAPPPHPPQVPTP
jgi:outer membrane protein, heavy metal efflux system